MLESLSRGPYKLSLRFSLYRALGVLGCVALALLCVGAYGYMGGGQAQAILHDQRLWDAGGPELEAGYKGKVTTRQFILKSYDLDVTYQTLEGALYQRQLEVETLFGSLAENQDARVRVSATDPKDFALNLAVEASGSRWAAVAFYWVVGIGLLGGCFGYLAFLAAKQWRRVKRCAERGVFQLCPLARREQVLNQGRPTGAEEFFFRVQGPRGEQVVRYQFRTKGSAALTNAAGSEVVALVPADAPEEAILVLETLYPLDVPKTVRERILTALGKQQKRALAS